MYLWKMSFELYRSGHEEYWPNAKEEHGRSGQILTAAHGPELLKLDCGAAGLSVHALFQDGRVPKVRSSLLTQEKARALLGSPVKYLHSTKADSGPYHLFP